MGASTDQSNIAKGTQFAVSQSQVAYFLTFLKCLPVRMISSPFFKFSINSALLRVTQQYDEVELTTKLLYLCLSTLYYTKLCWNNLTPMKLPPSSFVFPQFGVLTVKYSAVRFVITGTHS